MRAGVTPRWPQLWHWGCSHMWGDGMLLLLLRSQGKQPVCTCEPARLILRDTEHKGIPEASSGQVECQPASVSISQAVLPPVPLPGELDLRPHVSQPGHGAVLTRRFPLQELIQSPQAFLHPVRRERPQVGSMGMCGKYWCCGLQSILLMHASIASSLGGVLPG